MGVGVTEGVQVGTVGVTVRRYGVKVGEGRAGVAVLVGVGVRVQVRGALPVAPAGFCARSAGRAGGAAVGTSVGAAGSTLTQADAATPSRLKSQGMVRRLERDTTSEFYLTLAATQ